MSSSNTNSPLLLWQPQNIFIFFSFYSPIILSSLVVLTSVISQNTKGLIYLGFLIASVGIRSAIYWAGQGFLTGNNYQGSNIFCNSIKYTNYGNPTFSAFVFSFTIAYLCIPMFMGKDTANIAIFVVLLLYALLDISTKSFKGCIDYKTMTMYLLADVIGGFSIATAIVIAFITTGSAKWMFFNEVSNGQDVCYKPSKQTFKCKLNNAPPPLVS